MKATDQRTSTYTTPEAKIIASPVRNVICQSPTGSTSNEGYSEEMLEW